MKKAQIKPTGKEGEEPRMFVGGLFPETTSETVRAYFETFGSVKDVKIIGEKQKRSRGFGFILFNSFDTLNKVMAQKHSVGGREVDCNFAVYSNKTDKDEAAQKNEKKIFLSELPSSIVKQELVDTFENFGDIEKVMIVKRKNKDHSFGFVIFVSKDSAKKALKIKMHQVGAFVVECQIAQPKIRSYLNKVKSGEDGEEIKKKKKKKRKNKSKENSKAVSKISSKEADNLYNEQSVNNIIRDTKSNKNKNKYPSSEDFLLDQKLLSLNRRTHTNQNTSVLNMKNIRQDHSPNPNFDPQPIPTHLYNKNNIPPPFHPQFINSQHPQQNMGMVQPPGMQTMGNNIGQFNNYNYINNHYHFTIPQQQNYTQSHQFPQNQAQKLQHSEAQSTSSISYLKNLQNKKKRKESSKLGKGKGNQAGAEDNFMFESYLPDPAKQEETIRKQAKIRQRKQKNFADSKSISFHSNSSQISITNIISGEVKQRRITVKKPLNLQHKNYRFNQNMNGSQLSRESLPSQHTGGSNDSANFQQMSANFLSPNYKSNPLNQNIFNSNNFTQITEQTDQVNNNTVSNSQVRLGRSGMEMTVTKSLIPNNKEPLRRTATQKDKEKKSNIPGDTPNKQGGGNRLNEVHRKLPKHSQIYSDRVSLNHGWSGDSDNGLEDENQIEVINEVTKKRANSADLDNLEESEVESKKRDKKKMVTSAVQMQAMKSSKLTSKF